MLYFMGYNDPPEQVIRRRNEIPNVINLIFSKFYLQIDFSPLDQTLFFVPPPNMPWYRKFTSILFSPVRWIFSAVMSVFHFLSKFSHFCIFSFVFLITSL